MLANLISQIIMQGLQKNPETGQRNIGTGQFWGNVGRAAIPGRVGQAINTMQQNPLTQTVQQKECPDPNGVHGPGVMMNLISAYGIPMYMCPVCGYREPAGQQA